MFYLCISIRTKVIAKSKFSKKNEYLKKVFFKNLKFWISTILIVLLNICENQNDEKIIANTGNFRKEPRRMTHN